VTTSPRLPIGAARAVAFAAALALSAASALAQNRGVYPLGMTATNSGTVAAPGFTYANAFLFYGRDESKGPDGETIATGSNAVLMDMNTLTWASEPIAALCGLRLALAATIPIANNSLASDAIGSISGGGGLADSFYQPVILGWIFSRIDLRAAYGFLAPTGRFHAGASDNVGSGYWTHTLSLGENMYLTGNRALVLSAFQIYEFHTTQEGTGIHPGQTLSLDYSLTQRVSLRKDVQLQVGLAGYDQWQTTGRSGPDLTPAEFAARYRVNAIGATANVVLPGRKVNVGAKYLKEFSNRSTFQGYSIQIFGSLGF